MVAGSTSETEMIESYRFIFRRRWLAALRRAGADGSARPKAFLLHPFVERAQLIRALVRILEAFLESVA